MWRNFLSACCNEIAQRAAAINSAPDDSIWFKRFTFHTNKRARGCSLFGDRRFMEVTLFAALIAGLVSFLSPCVLPLVPGYISMLSGIGVEQLRQGEQPRNSLMASAFAFVAGFSVVFISFGASASAVGHFLHQNRSLLAPIAGAVVLLFGLHLIGWLAKLSWNSAPSWRFCWPQPAPQFIFGRDCLAIG